MSTGDLMTAVRGVAGRYPERVAVRCGERELSYREWRRRRGGWRRPIQGADGGDRATGWRSCWRGRWRWWWRRWECWRRGSSYVPLDPETPEARLGLVLEDSVADAGGDERGAVGAAAGGDGGAAGGRGGWFQGAGSYREPGELGWGRRAYVIFTSGTTGRPKGVEVTHGKRAEAVRGQRGAVGFGCEEVWSLFHSFAFDFSVWEIGERCCTGDAWWWCRGRWPGDPGAFWRLLREQRVTVLSQTPTAFRQLMLEERRACRASGAEVGGVRGRGAALLGPGEVGGEVRGRGGRRWSTCNGITETTVHAS